MVEYTTHDQIKKQTTREYKKYVMTRDMFYGWKALKDPIKRQEYDSLSK